jgi:hypothetical protein
MGQSARARGVVREIQGLPNPTPALANAGQVSDVIVSAWGIGSATADKSRKLFENVRSGVSAIRDPAAKAKAASAAATAIASQSRTPEQTAQPLLAQAAEAVGQITDAGQKQEAGDQVVVATAQVLLAGVNAAAKTGNWERANDLATRLQAATKQGRTAGANARVMALLYQAKSVTSADGSAVQALESAIAEANKAASLTERTLALQAVGEIAGVAAAPSILKSLQAIEPIALQAAGTARVQALGAMSAAYASLGEEAKAEDMRRQIATSTGVPALDQQTEMAKALIRADVSLARFQQKTGAFAQAENTIMRAASYLFAQAK